MTTNEPPPTSEDMIRLAQEAAREAAAPTTPDAAEPPVTRDVAPEPVSDPGRRLLAARRRHQARVDATAVDAAPPAIPRNARALAAVVVAIALLGFGIAILIAAMAATP